MKRRKAGEANSDTQFLALMEEAAILCDRLAFIAAGRIVAEGTPLQLRRETAERLETPLDAVTLETVFMDLTGRSIEEDEEREEESREEAVAHG